MLSLLIIKHISDSNFHFGMFQHFPFAEYKMDMVIGHSFVMVKCRTTFYTIPFMKAVREKPYYIICLVLNKTFWKCNDKLSSFNTFPCCSACLKIQLILSGKIFPELWCCSFRLIGSIEMFLSFRIGNIVNSSCHIRQLVLSDKWMSAYKHSPFRLSPALLWVGA